MAAAISASSTEDYSDANSALDFAIFAFKDFLGGYSFARVLAVPRPLPPVLTFSALESTILRLFGSFFSSSSSVNWLLLSYNVLFRLLV
jgi:hypothetical protein